MTRIACIGNSHIAAYKEARDDIYADFPGLRLQFFGLRNPVFFRSAETGGAALRMAQPLDETTDQLTEPDGAYPLPLDAFDQILLTSHAFYLHHLVEDLSTLMVDKGAGHSIDTAVRHIRRTHRKRARNYATRIRHFFPQLGHMTVVQAPFPSIGIVEHDPVYARFYDHPSRDVLFEAYQAVTATVCARRGLRYLPVDDAHLAEPFFTKSEFSRRGSQPSERATARSDDVHMNAAYARRSFNSHMNR